MSFAFVDLLDNGETVSIPIDGLSVEGGICRATGSPQNIFLKLSSSSTTENTYQGVIQNNTVICDGYTLPQTSLGMQDVGMYYSYALSLAVESALQSGENEKLAAAATSNFSQGLNIGSYVLVVGKTDGGQCTYLQAEDILEIKDIYAQYGAAPSNDTRILPDSSNFTGSYRLYDFDSWTPVTSPIEECLSTIEIKDVDVYENGAIQLSGDDIVLGGEECQATGGGIWLNQTEYSKTRNLYQGLIDENSIKCDGQDNLGSTVLMYQDTGTFYQYALSVAGASAVQNGNVGKLEAIQSSEFMTGLNRGSFMLLYASGNVVPCTYLRTDDIAGIDTVFKTFGNRNASVLPTPSPTVTASPSPSTTPSPSSAIPSQAPTSSIDNTTGRTPSPSPSLFANLNGVTVNGTEDDGSACFPLAAKVQLADGSMIRMDEIRIGDSIRSSSTDFSTVLMFTHANPEIRTDFIIISTDTATAVLSPNHYLYVNGKLATARSVLVGDSVSTIMDGVEVESAVQNIEMASLEGLYNPQTASGKLAVYWNGGDAVLASSYTTAIHPILAHMLLSPLRWLESILGMTVPFLSHNLANGSELWAAVLPGGGSEL